MPVHGHRRIQSSLLQNGYEPRGRSAKATPTDSIARAASFVENTAKIDLDAVAMTDGHFYGANIDMGSNKNATRKAIWEAETHDNPDLIIACAMRKRSSTNRKTGVMIFSYPEFAFHQKTLRQRFVPTAG